MDHIRALKEWFVLKIVFKQGDIWWCSAGMNLGEEVYGKGVKFTRPVLVFRKFTANSFLGLPLTIQENQGSWYIPVELHGIKRWAMLNQARAFDRKRLHSRIGTLSERELAAIRGRFLKFYAS